MTRRKIMVFASLLPVPVDRGDKNRLFHLLQLLRRFTDVCLVCCRREWETPVKDFSQLDGIEIRMLNVSKSEVIWEAAKAMLTFRPHIAFYFGMARLVQFVRRTVGERIAAVMAHDCCSGHANSPEEGAHRPAATAL